MKKITILGIGNRLMKDDGIGIYIVEELMKERILDVNYSIGETDVDYCLEVIEETDYLIVIDAVESGSDYGAVSMVDLKNINPGSLGISAHNIHLFHQLKCQGSPGVLIGIEPFMVSFHWGLSEELNDSLPMIIKKVKRNIKSTIKSI
ncbi:hydrogenase maturation protease [Thalassobacillus hwangdonensis]|uniref:Hydrogenase maturation protease n=1 Tax=Thalassobacillus hwangdonensis TaxID=546108 RepID=A0ABW3KXU7_9BACI